MKFSDIFKRQAFVISIAIVFVGLIILGVSYALFVVESSGSTNSISLGSLVATFNKGTTITAEVVPKTDIEAINDSSTLYSYSLENTGTIDMDYNLVLDSLGTDATHVDHKYIKIQLNNDTPIYLDSLTKANAAVSGINSQYVISSGVMESGASLSNQKIRLWVSSYGSDGSKTPISVLSLKVNYQFLFVGEVLMPYNEDLLAGADPVLDSKMLPVTIADDGTVKIADIYSSWYDYESKQWANAVIVDSSFTTKTAGTTIPMDKIEQMYVWIPRYSYDSDSIVSASEAIDVTFVDKTKAAHPAFTFGDAELSGIWVGKFEMGFDDGESETTTDVEYIIKPNVNSVHDTNVSTLFDKINNAMTTYSMDATTDVHMMKNTEWGAVAYLSQSKYGVCNSDGTCTNKINNNNYYNSSTMDIVTGCGGDDTPVANNVTGIDICPGANRWTTSIGVGASSTHNITGIYDMAGGRNEYVMGNMLDTEEVFYPSKSGFSSAPQKKYYDIYTYSTTVQDYGRGLLGDATIEMNPSNNRTWNNTNAFFVNITSAWFLRGGRANNGNLAGVWNFASFDGNSYNFYSSRSVLSTTY